MNRPEQQLQRSAAYMLRLTLKPPAWLSAIGHGGGGKKRGAILKSMGLMPGLGDLMVCWPLYIPGGLALERVCPQIAWIELKSKKGVQSDDQRLFAQTCRRTGHFYAICRDLPSVYGALVGWGCPLRKIRFTAADSFISEELASCTISPPPRKRGAPIP